MGQTLEAAKRQAANNSRLRRIIVNGTGGNSKKKQNEKWDVPVGTAKSLPEKENRRGCNGIPRRFS
jgi:hypothetical protein